MACGGWIQTLDATDVYSGWTETRAVRNQAQVHVFAALLEMRKNLPFALLGLDSDNGKLFSSRFGPQPGEVLFDRILRENGIRHLLTAPSSPTTTGKVERFHKTLRCEFLSGGVFASLEEAQAELDAWVAFYNQERPHQGIGMVPPAERFSGAPSQLTEPLLPCEDKELPALVGLPARRALR